ncbi:MAG: septum site-determining protein MinC [Thermodesulfobacteriota bacterium]
MKTTHPEKTSVRLKGVGNSLCVMLDPMTPAEHLRTELEKLFTGLKDEVENAKVTIDVGAPEGYDELIDELGRYLKDAFKVGSVERARRKKPRSRRIAAESKVDRLRRRDMERSWHDYRTDVLMLTGRVRSGQKVTARKHLLILGDVNPGAEVMAGGDILIMGSLLGTAIAGHPEGDGNIILALDFRPTQVQIGSYVAAGLPASPVKVTEFAHVENGNIVVENYLEANPFGRLPWPQVR